MEPRTRDYQQMAIAVLAIATAALGFAIWAQDLDLAYPVKPDSGMMLLYGVRVATPNRDCFLFPNFYNRWEYFGS